jgi:hypothetical protein
MADCKAVTTVQPVKLQKAREDNERPALVPGCAFFDRLNYDIRITIYGYVDLPPPLSYGRWHRGFVLSCKQAHAEAAEATARQLRTYLLEFQVRINTITGFDCLILEMPLYNGFEALKTLVFELPIAAMDNFEVKKFEPVLKKRFTKVVFLFKGCPDAARKSITTEIENHVDWEMLSRHGIVRNTTSPWIHRAHMIVWDIARKLQQCMVLALYTKRISIAWDLRSASETMVDTPHRRPLLTGFQHEYAAIEKKELRKFDRYRIDSYFFPARFELNGLANLVGECGMMSEERWRLLHCEALSNLWETKYWVELPCRTPIESEGIGREYRRGSA